MEDQLSDRAMGRGPQPPTATAVWETVRRLVDQLRHSRRPRGPSAAPTCVLLDVKMDGARCVVISVDPDGDGASLTPRERQIVELVALGHPNKTIAAKLRISRWTVGTHLRRAFAKLRVNSRAELVARAIQRGLLTIDFPPS